VKFSIKIDTHALLAAVVSILSTVLIYKTSTTIPPEVLKYMFLPINAIVAPIVAYFYIHSGNVKYAEMAALENGGGMVVRSILVGAMVGVGIFWVSIVVPMIPSELF